MFKKQIRACANDLAEAEATVATYVKALKHTKDQQSQLMHNLQDLRNERLNLLTNNQIQLVMKKGLVEVALSGQISDFDDCILTTKQKLMEVNNSIKVNFFFHKISSLRL